jgi:LL-diaminopimelate aminotransferase
MSIQYQNLFSKRIGGRQFGHEKILYKFENIKLAKREAARLNPTLPLLDFGVDEPDWIADEQVINILSEEASRWENRGYADNGVLGFKEAATGYMEHVYGVEGLNPITEINHCMGSNGMDWR